MASTATVHSRLTEFMLTGILIEKDESRSQDFFLGEVPPILTPLPISPSLPFSPPLPYLSLPVSSSPLIPLHTFFRVACTSLCYSS